MEIESLEVYARDSNYAIIKPPGRNYPGCVIQGDSLSILCESATQIAKAVKHGDTKSEDFLDNVESLNNALIGRLLHYQQVLAAHGISLPYGRPITADDRIKLLPEDEEDN